MTALASAQRSPARWIDRPGSMALLFVRHALIFGGLAALAYGLRALLPAPEQPVVWLGAALLIGASSALIAGGWLGIVFLPVGATLGVLLEQHLRLGPGAPAAVPELGAAAPVLLAALGAMLLAYAALLLFLGFVRRRRG
ncbi:hypothetical protein BH24CHL6_BH24CHL6_09820 [soil metagenome]